MHYAGRVDYVTDGWKLKNMDPLNENVVEVLQRSTEPLMIAMWKGGMPGSTAQRRFRFQWSTLPSVQWKVQVEGPKVEC